MHLRINAFMKNVFLLVVVFACGCNEPCEQDIGSAMQASYRELEFAFSDTWGSAFILKFTGGDTVYESLYFPCRRPLLRGLLTEEQQLCIDSFMKVIPFQQLRGSYDEHIMDGTCYTFYACKDSFAARIYVNSGHAPALLTRFAARICNIRASLRMTPLAAPVHFRLDKVFGSPPRPAVTYTTPHVICLHDHRPEHRHSGAPLPRND
jgi:hypothetical protein